MKVYLSNLGSIKYGEIELGDITLFVGKPNTGKSLVMKTILREDETKGVVYLPYSRPFFTFQNLVSKDSVTYDEKVFSCKVGVQHPWFRPLLKLFSLQDFFQYLVSQRKA